MSRARHRRAEGANRENWLRAGIATSAAVAAGVLAASCLLVSSGPSPTARLTAADAAASQPPSSPRHAFNPASPPAASPAEGHSPQLEQALSGSLTGTGMALPSQAPNIAAAPLQAASGTTLNGIDVASYQHPCPATSPNCTYPNGAAINWSQVAGSGINFAAIKATEGTHVSTGGYNGYYANPYYVGDAQAATAAGIYVSAYHFANPYNSGGAAQADLAAQYAGMAQNAPDYKVGGLYLPLMLDLEYNPYTPTDGNECYNLTPAQMVTWVTDFVTEATTLTGAAPIIYTPTSWWNLCTGSSTAFGSDMLWIPSYSSASPSTLPAGWSNWTFWQYTSSGTVPGISGTGDVDLDYMSATLPAITSADQTTFDAGAPGSFTVTATGFPAPTFSESGTLPSGVTFSNGVLSGTPPNGSGGTYPITITATSGAGTATQAFTLIVPIQPSTYNPMGPVRVLDTRNGTGGFSAPVGPGGVLSLQVDGVDGVPTSGVTAVVLNVTVVTPTAFSYLAVYPDGQARTANSPSNLNFRAGETIPNLVVVPVGADGKVDFYNNQGSTQVVADLEGYYAASGGSSYNPVGPTRVLDTRIGTGGFSAPVGPGGVLSLQVTGQNGVPATGVTAVVLNVTVVTPTAFSYLAVYPDGQTRTANSPSNLNYSAGETIPNLVVVPVGADGKVDFYNDQGSTQVVADLAGYYTASGGSSYVPAGPVRVLDTRYGTGGFSVPVGPGGVLSLQVTGKDGVPATGVTAVVLNVTVVTPSAFSYLAVYPDGQTRTANSPSNLNYSAGETIPNLVVVPVGADGKVDFYNNQGSTDIVADLAGYYTSP